MSQTVLGALRRRVGALLQATPPGGHATEPDRPPAAALVTDGGQRGEREDDEHLRDVPDGAGCTEIWEHLSERQAAEVEVEAEVGCDD